MTKQDPVEGRQRETKEDKPGNHVVTKSVYLQELRTRCLEKNGEITSLRAIPTMIFKFTIT